MSANLWVGVGAVVLLGGGMIAFTQMRSGAQREADIAALEFEVIGLVQSEYAPPDDFDSEQGRVVLRSLRRARAEEDDVRLALAEARLLVALGQVRDAWDIVRPLATEPGAELMPQLIGAVTAARLGAETGDEGLLGQALSCARRYADATGGESARVLEWKLAFRVGDAAAMASAAAALLEAGGAGADLVGATSADLGELLGQRLGVDLSAADGGPLQDAIAKIVAQGSGRPTLRELDTVGSRIWPAVPELELVAARRALEDFGELPPEERRGGEAENLLRDAMRRVELALADVPTSVDARAVAVLAHLFMRESFGLDADAASRFRGHLDWLLSNGPKTHVQRAVWEQLARDTGR